MLQLIKLVLRRFPLFHWILHQARRAAVVEYRENDARLRRRLSAWSIQTKGVMEHPLGDGSAGTAVFFGWSKFEYVLAESVVRKAFERAGFISYVLAEPSPPNLAVYKAFGVEQLKSFNYFCPSPNVQAARRMADKLVSFKDLVELQFEGVTVGKYVSSTLMRRTRQGSIDIQDPKLRSDLVSGLATSISAVKGAQRMIRQLDAKFVVLVDRGYSPYLEVFDVCVNEGVQVVTWNMAHRDNTIMLKRYNQANRLAHPSSLSEKSWQCLLAMPWPHASREKGAPTPAQRLQTELSEAYSSGEWYSEVGTQFGKRAWGKDELMRQTGLDSNRRTAVIYAHIFWDATFFWGEDLFRDYEDWFVQTVKAACLNDKLNWLIKVHPANLVKDRRDGVTSDPSEVIALREQIGELPDHVKVIPADADITTLSLFRATDYCLTVRGTVGIEAAMLGKTVLTAGTGRYDRHGFTHDFDHRNDYLAALAQLHEIKDPEEAVRDKAARFGYGIFLCRPLSLTVFDLHFEQDEMASMSANIKVESVDELSDSKEFVAISEWLHSGDDDFLNCPDTTLSGD